MRCSNFASHRLDAGSSNFASHAFSDSITGRNLSWPRRARAPDEESSGVPAHQPRRRRCAPAGRFAVAAGCLRGAVPGARKCPKWNTSEDLLSLGPRTFSFLAIRRTYFYPGPKGHLFEMQSLFYYTSNGPDRIDAFWGKKISAYFVQPCRLFNKPPHIYFVLHNHPYILHTAGPQRPGKMWQEWLESLNAECGGCSGSRTSQSARGVH